MVEDGLCRDGGVSGSTLRDVTRLPAASGKLGPQQNRVARDEAAHPPRGPLWRPLTACRPQPWGSRHGQR